MKIFVSFFSAAIFYFISNNIYAQDIDYTKYIMKTFQDYVQESEQNDGFMLDEEFIIKLSSTERFFEVLLDDWYRYEFAIIGTDSFPNVGVVHLVPIDNKSAVDNSKREGNPFAFAVYYSFYNSNYGVYKYRIDIEKEDQINKDGEIIVRLYRSKKQEHYMYAHVGYNNLFPALGIGAIASIEMGKGNPIAPFGFFAKVTWSPEYEGDPDLYYGTKTGNSKVGSWASSVYGLVLETDFGHIYGGIG
jgi:hypothetical protein